MYDVKSLFGLKVPLTFIVAEIGINHEGKFELAKRLIEKAKESGADAVKFQVFKTEYFYNPILAKDGFELFKNFELSFDEFAKLKEFADSLDICFFATPLDPFSLKFLVELDVPAIKVASSDITCEPFLLEIADLARKHSKVVFLSTGFVGMEKVKSVFKFFRDCDFALLYCVSKYPANPEDIDLNVITTFRENFYVPVGFSDHTIGYTFSIGAVALGARIIEKHFTLDNGLRGADHFISLNPEDFSKMVKFIRELELGLKSGEKKVSDFEKKVAPLSMRGLYTARDIEKGEKITKDDILFLRPGNGIEMKEYHSLIGKKLRIAKKKYEKV